ncbi:hypothetical protein [Parasitella parasitica]|uniref:C3H1-type domain-containing protein n=1 Tax=Parasitella parasitica TaxID=35722 RepID=A0A0B7N1M1_9FUNG|nr:hypothetical protein [Parasitella parasitica]
MANKQLPADLESFVSKEVASLCDADPVVLAQYIIALIGNEERNDALKANLESKLNEFFDDQTIPFIDRLFAKINGSNSSNDLVAASSSNNTSKERFPDFSDEEDDGDRNFKHRRQRSNSPEEHSSRSYSKRRYDDDNGNSNSKYPRYDDRRSNPSAGYNRNGRGALRGGSRNGSGMSRGQNKPQCRDYNEKGFCMRGDMCPFDHGVDRIIVDEGANSPFPGGPFPNNGMPPMGRGVPGQPPFFGMPGVPDAYDPERSGLMANPEMGSFGGMMPPSSGDMMNMMRGGMRGRGRGRGRGGSQGNYQRHQHQNMNPLNTTLNVEKIPVENCHISTINDFFAKFGTITNISVQPHAQKAIIQYSTRAEAEAAYNSPDAIFDNRFVKVYWSKEDPSNPSNTTSTDKPANVVAAAPQTPVAPKVNEPDPELVAARAAEIAHAREEKQKKHQEQMKHILEIQKRRESQLQQQIDEQKRLLTRLTNSAGMTQTEKAELLKALKNIQSDIDTSKSAAATEAAQTKVAATAAASSTEHANTHVKEGEETTEELKKKLARLEVEAANLGIHSSGSGFRGGRGGYYGRGRGSWPRARGGMAPRPMSLDNRPTKISVKDIPESSNDTELRQHFQQFGNVTFFEQKDSEALIQYAQRFEAEKAMAVGANYPKGSLQLDWVSQTTEG